MAVELKPHQQKAVDQMHNGCVLVGGVGTGKSFTALFYFYTKVCKGVVGDPGSMRTPKDLIIITTAKKRNTMDWQRDAAQLCLGREQDMSAGAVKVTVDSWNNIGNYTDIEDAFFIFDEQRVVGSGAWSKSFIKIAKKNDWIVLSATPGDVWMDYVPIFVANGFYKNAAEFKRNHVVYTTYGGFPKVDRYVEIGTLIRHRRAVLVDMPYVRHTKRHIVDVAVDFDTEKFERVVNDRWHVYEDRPLRDVSELFIVMRKLVNSDSSRIKALRSLMEQHPRLIVFYNHNHELEKIREFATSLSRGTPTFVSGKKNSSIPKGLDQNYLSPSEDLDAAREVLMYGQAESGSDDDSVASRGRFWPHETPLEYINMIRRCLHIHSVSYYAHGRSLVSDAKFDSWCLELLELMDEFPELTDQGYEHELFSDFSGETGMHLVANDWVEMQLEWLYAEYDKDPDTWMNDSKNSSKRGETSSGSSIQLRSSATETITSSAMADDSFNSAKLVGTPGSSTSDERRTSSTMPESTSSLPLGLSSSTSNVDLSSTVFAEYNGHKHEEVPTSERWVYLVQYTAGAEGWNCVETDAMVFYSLTYSYKAFEQAQGRIDRLNTKYTDLYYFVFSSNALIDKAIKKALKMKKNFNESAFTRAVKFKEK